MVAWVSVTNSVPLMTSMNLGSVKSAGNMLRIMLLVPDYFNSNAVVCSVYLSKNYLFMRKVLVAGTDWEVGAL